MPVDLQRKVAIVTGGGSGVGRSVARALARSGASVVVTGRTAATLDAARDELEGLGARALAVVCDVREVDDIARCLDRTVEEFGRVDILVNNAHTITHGLLLDATDADMEDEWRSGPFAVFRFMRLAHPYLAAQGGVIVNFGSGAQALHDSKGWGLYGASKSAIQTLTRYAANEWGRDGIRVIQVLPLASSEGVERMRERDPETYARAVSRVPLGRFGDADVDVAQPIAWLVSDEARFITGSTIMLDGGQIQMR
jgi:NAD(P)-dependent dehydrogenase (short-subunit alcohol dehydrogenase family)